MLSSEFKLDSGKCLSIYCYMEYDEEIVFDIVSSKLPEAGVKVVMIGGHAVNYYGVTRATQDIDFMIASADEDAVKHIMRKSGFTNIAVHDTVVFFSRPESPMRVDFLKVNEDTMNTIMNNSVDIEYMEQKHVRVPQLQDLLAMKIFAWSQGGVKREAKDFADIVHLVMENNIDPDKELHELCKTFGTELMYTRITERIKELSNA